MPARWMPPDCDRSARALAFDHADEEAGPHLYRVRLAGGILPELTAGALVDETFRPRRPVGSDPDRPRHPSGTHDLREMRRVRAPRLLR